MCFCVCIVFPNHHQLSHHKDHIILMIFYRRIISSQSCLFNLNQAQPLSNSAMNSLQSLPAELFDDILYQINLKDIKSLALTGCVRLREKIIDWIKSASFQRTVERLLVKSNWRQVSRDYGLLVKNLTILHESSSRLRLLSDGYGRLRSLVSRDSLARRNQLWRKYLSRAGLASALAGLTKGWDVVEFHKILHWLREFEDLDGVNRRLVRTYFWEFLDSDLERGKWTSWLITTYTSLPLPILITDIETFSYKIRAFMMTVYGPANLGVTGAELRHLSERQVQVVTKSLGKTDFSVLCIGKTSWENLQFQVEELARAVDSLRGNLPEHLVISVVDELFNSSIQGMNKGE